VTTQLQLIIIIIIIIIRAQLSGRMPDSRLRQLVYDRKVMIKSTVKILNTGTELN